MWLGAQDDGSLRALNRAIDLGLTFIDTALAAGDGHSERLVGQVVRERAETVRVATKVPPADRRWPARAASRPTTPSRRPRAPLHGDRRRARTRPTTGCRGSLGAQLLRVTDRWAQRENGR